MEKPKGLLIANQLMDGICPTLLKEIKKWDEYLMPKLDKNSMILRSHSINLFDNTDINKECKKAISDIGRQLSIIKSLGFKFKIKDIHWHNVLDSCSNIQGNIGFFILNITFKKV